MLFIATGGEIYRVHRPDLGKGVIIYLKGSRNTREITDRKIHTRNKRMISRAKWRTQIPFQCDDIREQKNCRVKKSRQRAAIKVLPRPEAARAVNARTNVTQRAFSFAPLAATFSPTVTAGAAIGETRADNL